MLNISINLETGIARLAQTTSIKAGGGVPVKVTFSSVPGDNPVIELALCPQSSTASVLAYLGEFTAENDTTFLGALDANDTRLIAHLAGKDQVILDCETKLTVGDQEPQIFPNFQVTCQAPKMTGPQSSDGGPSYYSTVVSDQRFVRINVPFGASRFTSSGLCILDTVTGLWRRLVFVDGELQYPFEPSAPSVDPAPGTIYGSARVTASGVEILDVTTGVWRVLSFADGVLTFTPSNL